jgi:hypothetical protein
MLIDAAHCYAVAEQMAAEYYQDLFQQVTLKTYAPILTKDFRVWEQKHSLHTSFLIRWYHRKSKPEPQNVQAFISWLEVTGKLEDYLDRSVSYIFMRDLGKALDSPETQERIQQVVGRLRDDLTRLYRANQTEKNSLVSLYRKAQKVGIEATLLWVMDKLKKMSDHLPEEIAAEHAQRKVLKIIAGVLMHESEELSKKTQPQKGDEKESKEEHSRKMDIAIRLGYSYGLTYPLIDD